MIQRASLLGLPHELQLKIFDHMVEGPDKDLLKNTDNACRFKKIKNMPLVNRQMKSVFDSWLRTYPGMATFTTKETLRHIYQGFKNNSGRNTKSVEKFSEDYAVFLQDKSKIGVNLEITHVSLINRKIPVLPATLFTQAVINTLIQRIHSTQLPLRSLHIECSNYQLGILKNLIAAVQQVNKARSEKIDLYISHENNDKYHNGDYSKDSFVKRVSFLVLNPEHQKLKFHKDVEDVLLANVSQEDVDHQQFPQQAESG